MVSFKPHTFISSKAQIALRYLVNIISPPPSRSSAQPFKPMGNKNLYNDRRLNVPVFGEALNSLPEKKRFPLLVYFSLRSQKNR